MKIEMLSGRQSGVGGDRLELPEVQVPYIHTVYLPRYSSNIKQGKQNRGSPEWDKEYIYV